MTATQSMNARVVRNALETLGMVAELDAPAFVEALALYDGERVTGAAAEQRIARTLAKCLDLSPWLSDSCPSCGQRRRRESGAFDCICEAAST